MASDRKSIERTVCNPTITLSPNEETVIQSLSPYLSKTDFQLCDQECVSLSRSQPVWDLNTVHLWGSSLCFHDSFALICCFSCLVMYSCLQRLWMLEYGLNLTEQMDRKGNWVYFWGGLYSMHNWKCLHLWTKTHKTWIVIYRNVSKSRSEI